ncbi:solute carrier family 41 member 1-like [Gigantopelta aegis]|uniref:solute carrier family 41 member 1-like n=1 Tax=Gigantopelta aegis TaxID=1735272 RepID=UPI001B8898EE|nr:solute carrier family 41 member 1-like [Gigantopelta aegis]
MTMSEYSDRENLRSRRKKMVPKADPMTSYADEVELANFTPEASERSENKTNSGSVKLHSRDTDLGNGSAVVESELNSRDEEEQEEDDEESVEQPLLSHEDDGDNNCASSRTSVDVADQPQEKCLNIAFQVFIPYIIAGLGTVGAGLVLDVVQHWKVFMDVKEVFILVPALLGLKGNLEMTLASRLSTQANLGNMDTRSEKLKMIGGNLALVQAQAIVVGLVASVVAMVMGWIPEGEFNFHHGVLLCASSVFTAAVASFILGLIMVAVILCSRKFNINPDNVATPIAASLGDLITLSLLAAVATLLYNAIGKQVWLAPTVIVVFLVLIPLWVVISIKNRYTNEVIYSGWFPVLCAVFISSIGGLILDFSVGHYPGIAVFQPVINGVGGNLVAVQASRISTSLHRQGQPGEFAHDLGSGYLNPINTFFGKHIDSKAARVLLLLVVPGHLIFMSVIYSMPAGHTTITASFVGVYLLAALLQVTILLYIANWMIHVIWRKGDDPDNIAIPYLTALGDLLGTGFLALAFHFLYLVGDRDADVGE